MFLADAIAMLEKAMKPLIPGKVDAKYDEMFYDAKVIEKQREQIEHIHAREGSVLIVKPDTQGGDVTLCTSEDATATGEEFAKNVVLRFKTELDNLPTLDTVVIAGNATSIIGAAAFGKSIAEILRQPVASIVTGRGGGGVDTLFESMSGGMLMAPTAKLLCAWDEVLHETIKVNPFAKVMAANDVQKVTKSIDEAATLFEILKDQLLVLTNQGIELRKATSRRLKKVIGHSKANWAIVTALLNFELNILDQLPPPEPGHLDPKVDIVTLGNHVSLPDSNPTMLEIFHYHQFLGTKDIIGALGSSGYARLMLSGKYTSGEPVSHSSNPDEYLYIGRSHNVIESKPDCLPIKDILPQI